VLELFATLAVLAAHQPATPPPAPPPPSVKVGEQAPDFTLPYIESEDGKIARKDVTLSSFQGKKNVVLAFFPAAFSPG
jgi:hypothetical protein